MKKLFLAIATTAFLFACNSGEKEAVVAKNSDWYSQNLKGMVQTMEQSSYTPDSTGKIGEMDSCCIDLDEFDEKGYMLKSVSKDSKGTITWENTMEHYEKGQDKSFTTMKDGKLRSTFNIAIDENGKYTSAQSLDSAGKVRFYYTDLTEDEDGNVTSGKGYNPDSTFSSSFASEYKNGESVSNTSTDSTGKVTFSSKSELNDKGYVAKRTSTRVGKDSTTITVVTYTYDSFDETGNWTQRTTYDDKGKATKVDKRTYTYFKKE